MNHRVACLTCTTPDSIYESRFDFETAVKVATTLAAKVGGKVFVRNLDTREVVYTTP